jgi:hypothetical protein
MHRVELRWNYFQSSTSVLDPWLTGVDEKIGCRVYCPNSRKYTFLGSIVNT